MRFIAVLILGLQAQDAAKVSIAWSLKKGDKVRYEFEYTVVTTLRAETGETKLVAGLVLEATEVAKDGTATVKATIDRFAVKNSGHGRVEEYDSSREGDPPTSSNAKVMAKCVGKPFIMQLSPAGRISAMEGLKKLIQGAVDSLPEVKAKYKWGADGVERAARTLEATLNAGLAVPRGAPAAVGDSWEVRLEFKELADVAVAVSRCKLKEIRSGEALLDQAVSFEFPAEVAAEIKESSGKGSIWWDTGKGLLKSLNTTARIKTTMGDITVTLSVLQAPAPAKKD